MTRLGMALALTAACALMMQFSLGCERKTPEEKLRERAALLLQSRVDGRWGQVYDLYDADYRGSISREDFMRRSRNMQFLSFTIEGVEVMPSGKEGVVKVKEKVSIRAFTFDSPVVAQSWIQGDDGKWYMKVGTPQNPFTQMFQQPKKTPQP